MVNMLKTIWHVLSTTVTSSIKEVLSHATTQIYQVKCIHIVTLELYWSMSNFVTLVKIRLEVYKFFSFLNLTQALNKKDATYAYAGPRCLISALHDLIILSIKKKLKSDF